MNDISPASSRPSSASLAGRAYAFPGPALLEPSRAPRRIRPARNSHRGRTSCLAGARRLRPHPLGALLLTFRRCRCLRPCNAWQATTPPPRRPLRCAVPRALTSGAALPRPPARGGGRARITPWMGTPLPTTATSPLVQAAAVTPTLTGGPTAQRKAGLRSCTSQRYAFQWADYCLDAPDRHLLPPSDTRCGPSLVPYRVAGALRPPLADSQARHVTRHGPRRVLGWVRPCRHLSMSSRRPSLPHLGARASRANLAAHRTTGLRSCASQRYAVW